MTGNCETFKFRYLVTDNITGELLGVASLRHPVNDLSKLNLMPDSSHPVAIEKQLVVVDPLISDLDLSQDSSTNETYDDEEANVTFSQEIKSPLVKDIPTMSNSKCSQKLETFDSQPIVKNAPFPALTFKMNPSVESASSRNIVDSVRTALHDVKESYVEGEVNSNGSPNPPPMSHTCEAVDNSSIAREITDNEPCRRDMNLKTSEGGQVLISEEEQLCDDVNKNSETKENNNMANNEVKLVAKVDPVSRDERNYIENLSPTSKMHLFFSPIASEGNNVKNARGFCMICNDLERTISRQNFPRHFRDCHLPKITCPGCNNNFSRTRFKIHKKNCLK